MTVSVLVPVYGVEKYIGRCAESLFKQTYPDIEYVFVDDCTPDRSIDILHRVMERYPIRRPQVRIIRNAKNMGVGATRAAALSAATGEYVMHADSDDHLPADAVERLVRKMETSGADIVDGAYRLSSPDGLSSPILPYQSRDTEKYLKLLLCQNIVKNNIWGRIFRRSLYTDNGINFKPGVNLCEDYSIMCRLLFFAKRDFINDVVYFYNDDNATSYTHTMSDKHLLSFIGANRIVADFFKEHDTEGRFSMALQTGLINMLRTVRMYGKDETMKEATSFYKPKGISATLLAAMFRGRFPYPAADYLYRLARLGYRLLML